MASDISTVYQHSLIWATIDLEQVEDMNSDLIYKSGDVKLDYPRFLDRWMELCDAHQIKSTCFTLGKFARRYPQKIKELCNNGHEIASHGMAHDLVYKLSFADWQQSIIDSKNMLQDLIGQPVTGYRSPSWSLPYEPRYYAALIEAGYTYSSSYFPFKTYLYGHSEDKKQPFVVQTGSGDITEIPVPKYILPFSGGFYLRVIPYMFHPFLIKRLLSRNVKPVLYVHPYELMQTSIMAMLSNHLKFNKGFFIVALATSSPFDKLDKLLSRFCRVVR